MKTNLLFVLLVLIVLYTVIESKSNKGDDNIRNGQVQFDSTWIAPSLFIDRSVLGKERTSIIFGKELVAHTAKYLGPHGIISKSSNRMNCQNCHLDAGTRPWGNNFGGAYSLYPQYKARSNSIQTVFGRIKDCFERSMNGSYVDTTSYAVRSIYSYIKWLGKDVQKGKRPYGSGNTFIPLLLRAADPGKGAIIYATTCSSCHGDHGQGALAYDSTEYLYPPLWGDESYNDGSGLVRLSNFAGFVYNNMPYNIASHQTPVLSIEDAWDVAAFVNSRPRPHKYQEHDWPNLKKKPFDAPSGPYIDTFSQYQHTYGPYQNIMYFDSLIATKYSKRN